eukprot:NODE_127_length_18646_cov_0.421632.p8 type:complete len:150 gc:universal NODE_127_length_18646_cov_0.421632:14285-14734(+)
MSSSRKRERESGGDLDLEVELTYTTERYKVVPQTLDSILSVKGHKCILLKVQRMMHNASVWTLLFFNWNFEYHKNLFEITVLTRTAFCLRYFLNDIDLCMSFDRDLMNKLKIFVCEYPQSVHDRKGLKLHNNQYNFEASSINTSCKYYW